MLTIYGQAYKLEQIFVFQKPNFGLFCVGS